METFINVSKHLRNSNAIEFDYFFMSKRDRFLLVYSRIKWINTTRKHK